MIRATTGGVLKNYRSSLMKSYISQNNAMKTILTQRTFNSYAEDPASAAKAFRLRKSRMMVNNQHDICADTLKKYETAYSSLQSVDEVLDTDSGQYTKTLKGTTLSMLNDPSGDAREQLSKVLDQMSEMLVQNMNQKYGDKFIFAGADGHNVPFEVVDGQLTYRGVPVDAAVPKVMQDNGADVKMPNGDFVLASATTIPADRLPDLEQDGGAPLTVTATGKPYYVKDGAVPEAAPADPSDYTQVTLKDGTTTFYKNDDLVDQARYDADMASVVKQADGTTPAKVTIDGKDCYVMQGGTMTQQEYDKVCQDAEKLDYLAKEKLFVDIGLGFQENEDGKLIESSAFDASLNGISFMGYGLDADGDPKNLYSLVQKMREVADSVPVAGKWEESTWTKFNHLVGKFETACSEFKTEFTNLAAGTTKLDTNEQLLKDNFYNLQDQYAELEDIEPVEAINNFLWAQYAYNAALKVGNSVLSQSLMDYLN